jgi:predicted nuclease with TOPRIM domain
MFGQSAVICCREDELSQYQTENHTMVNELTSLRNENFKLQRALAKEITKVEDLQKRDSENAFRCAM